MFKGRLSRGEVSESEQVRVALHGSDSEQIMLAKHEGVCVAAQEVLAGSSDKLVLAALAANTALAPGVQEVLAACSSILAVFVLAQNPSLVPSLQVRLSFSKDTLVLNGLVTNERFRCSPQMRASVVREFDRDLFGSLAGDVAEEALGLAHGWEGSLVELVEAARLVRR